MTTSGYRVGFNTLDTPLPADNQGHVLGGLEFGLILATADPVRQAVDRGDLAVLPASVELPAGSPARASYDRFAAAETNAETLAPYDRETLYEVAADAGIDTVDGPNKAELVARLAVLDPFPTLPPLDPPEELGAAAAEVAEPESIEEPPGEVAAHTPAPTAEPEPAKPKTSHRRRTTGGEE